MTSFGEGLIEAAHQAVAIAGGGADSETYRLHTPSQIDIKAIRKALDLTQTQFASRFGFPIGTLRDLKQGRAQPDSSTRAYLLVISREPALVQRVLESV